MIDPFAQVIAATALLTAAISLPLFAIAKICKYIGNASTNTTDSTHETDQD